MVRMILVLVYMCCFAVAAIGQPGHFNGSLFGNSDFVIEGVLIGRDTIAVEFIPYGGYELPSELFSRGQIDRAALNKRVMGEFMRQDSTKRAKDAAERVVMEKPLKRKKSKYSVVSAPPGPVVYAGLGEKIVRYTYRVSTLYKTCWTYGNEFPQANMNRGDTISLLIMQKHLDSFSIRKLTNRELNIYFNEQYYNERVPSIFKTRALKQFYYQEKMYWMDPKRMWKVEEVINQR